MGESYVEGRAEARRKALTDQNERARARRESERRRDAYAVQVNSALAERQALVRASEIRAGQYIDKMVDEEGLSLRDAIDWCGGDLSVAEAKRLREAAIEDRKAQAQADAADRAAATQTPPSPGI